MIQIASAEIQAASDSVIPQPRLRRTWWMSAWLSERVLVRQMLRNHLADV